MNPRIAFFFLTFLNACGGAGKPPEKPADPDRAQLRPAVLPAYATLDVMINRKLARRLAIELNESVSFAAIETALDAGGLDAGIDVAVSSSRYVGAVSKVAGRALGTDASRLDDLDAMAASDATLASTLTSQVRRGIAAEAALRFEYLMRSSSSVLLDVFSGNSSVMSPAVASLWGVTGTPAWVGRSELLVSYADGRPPLGMIVSQAHVSSATRLGGSSTHPESRAGAFFVSRFRCVPLATTHDFTALRSADVSAAGLATVKLTTSPCAGCHNVMTAAGNALTGLGRPGGITAYRAFNGGVGTTWPGNWFGSEVNSWTDFSHAMAGDEAVRACLTQRVFESIAQRPANYGRDIPRLAAIPASIDDSGFPINDWIKEIISSPAVTSGPTVASSKVSTLEGQVMKSRWMDAGKMLEILAEASPLAAADLDAIADNLAPAEERGAGDSGKMILPLSRPTAIWNAVQSAATAVVQREFAVGVTPGSRGIFHGVADPALLTSSDVRVLAGDVWQKMTGEELSTSRGDTFVDLYQLAVNESSAGTSRLKAQDGLVAVMASIFMSPFFLSY